jgi:hypothetical protein
MLFYQLRLDYYHRTDDNTPRKKVWTDIFSNGKKQNDEKFLKENGKNFQLIITCTQQKLAIDL